MGAWGEGPYDNDTAADWFYGLESTGIYALIESGLASNDYYEQRAAAWLVQKLAESAYVYNVDKIDEHRRVAVEKLQGILNDDEWLDCWRDRNVVEESIRNQINEIQNPNASPGLMEKMCKGLE